MTWIWLILASLLSCAGQLCQKQATRPAKAGRRGVHIALWLGLALLALGSGMLVWLVVLQRLPVGIAYPMLSLNFVWVTLAAKVSQGITASMAANGSRPACLASISAWPMRPNSRTLALIALPDAWNCC